MSDKEEKQPTWIKVVLMTIAILMIVIGCMAATVSDDPEPVQSATTAASPF